MNAANDAKVTIDSALVDQCPEKHDTNSSKSLVKQIKTVFDNKDKNLLTSGKYKLELSIQN